MNDKQRKNRKTIVLQHKTKSTTGIIFPLGKGKRIIAIFF